MRSQLGAALNAEVPPSWPHEHWEPHVYDYMLNLIAQDPEAEGWCSLSILLRQGSHRTLIGTCGSGFPKPDTGLAEIGYGLLAEFQRQGIAVEAMEALCYPGSKPAARSRLSWPRPFPTSTAPSAFSRN